MKRTTSTSPGLIRVYDLDGKMVMASEYKAGEDKQIVELNTSKLNAGIYFVQISGVGISEKRKLSVADY